MKKIIVFTFIFSLFLTSCSEEKNEIIKKYYKTTSVQSGSISESQSDIWYTDSFNNVTLWAKIWWKITSITKNIWDKVHIWEIVAILDSSEAKTWFNSSNEIILSLESLKNSTSQMYDAQIKVMNEKIKSAQTWIEIAHLWVSGSELWTIDTKNITQNQLKTVETQISSAETQIETAKLQLENSRISFNQKEIDIYSNSKNAISNANILMSNEIDFLDNLFWVTDANKYKNDSFEIYIWAKNSTLKSQIESDFRNLLLKISNIKKLPLDTNNDIENALQEYNTLFSIDIRNILNQASITMENSISNTTFTENIIQNYKTQITALQNQNEQAIITVSWNYFLWLKGSIDSIANFQKEKKSTLDMLEKQQESALKQMETLKQTLSQISSIWDWQITDINTKTEISKKQKELSQNGLSEILASLDSLKKQKNASLSELDTQIYQVASWKNNAWVMIENGKVISLLDGIVTKKLSEVGSIVWPWTPILVVSSNDTIKIEVQIPEELLSKINIWNSVQAEIEWSSELKNGVITKKLPVRDMLTKKSSIEITLENKKWDIKIWSYSKIYFHDNNSNTGIIIPNNALLTKFMIPQVFVLEWKKALLKDIEIEKQNDNFSQIRWLNIWEIIITEWKENIFDGEILQ